MNITFTDLAFQRYKTNCYTEYPKHHSLDEIISSLMKWEPFDNTVTIMCDGENSFFFRERDKDGKSGMCGGIILHGSEGYSIHT